MKKNPETGAAMDVADYALSLLATLQRARAVINIAIMDGTVRNTLWARADETLLDYLDNGIASGLEKLHDMDYLRAPEPAQAGMSSCIR